MFEIILLSYLIKVLLSWMVSGVNVCRCECGTLKSLYILAYIITIISNGIEDKSATASTEFLELPDVRNNLSLMQNYSFRDLRANSATEEEVPAPLYKDFSQITWIAPKRTRVIVPPKEDRQSTKNLTTEFFRASLGIHDETLNLTKERKNKIIRLHNHFRNLIASGLEARGAGGSGQPPAQNIPEIQWDDSAAEQAETWAKRCYYGYLQFEGKRGIKNPLGQNVGVHPSNFYCSIEENFEENVDKIVEEWYDKVEEFDYNDKSRIETSFTAIISTNHPKLGCSVSNCLATKQPHKNEVCSWLALFCYYVKTEKMNPETLYIAGKQNCSAYKMQASRHFSHLCTTELYDGATSIYLANRLINCIFMVYIVIYAIL